MRSLIYLIIVLLFIPMTVCAQEYTAPPVPQAGAYIFPEESENFTDGILEIITDALQYFYPAFTDALRICLCIIVIAMLMGLISCFPGTNNSVVELISAVAISACILEPTRSMIVLCSDTVSEICTYGKLLLPVLSSALCAQGGTTTAGTIYFGTVVFDTLISTALSSLLIPMIYIFLFLCVADCAVGNDMLGKLSNFVKWIMTWLLKLLLYLFMGYISLTGVISGATDAAAIKATKLTISSMVPVIGGILSDASETILVSAGLLKNSAGIYGILALLSITVIPFMKIGVQYLVLKLTAAICSMFAPKRLGYLLNGFSTAMGYILALTGTICLVQLISTVCFMKGVT